MTFEANETRGPLEAAAGTRRSWETWIDAMLADRPLVPLTALAAAVMGRPLTRSEYNSLTRAAHRMAARGRIGLVRAFGEDSTGRMNVQLLAVRAEYVERLRADGVAVKGAAGPRCDDASVPNGTVSPCSPSQPARPYSAPIPWRVAELRTTPAGSRRLRGSVRWAAAILREGKTTTWRHVGDLLRAHARGEGGAGAEP
jgi:hypothetical protein